MITLKIYKTAHNDKIISMVDDMILYIRHKEKDFQELKSEHSGGDYLRMMLSDGIIKMPLFLDMVKLLHDPELKYTITIVPPEPVPPA